MRGEADLARIECSEGRDEISTRCGMDLVSFDLRTNDPVTHSTPTGDRLTPWEEVEPGRFRPRRIKGSHVGRELG